MNFIVRFLTQEDIYPGCDHRSITKVKDEGIYILGGVRKVRMRFNYTLLNHQATEVRAQGVSFR